ncbi:MAG TPA: MMPL family transporter [Chloroflexota bacterium]|nr:MMPL family transporter [Chloroflexota bacterium]
MFAALGRFAYRRRWLIVALWLVVVLVGLPLLPSLPARLRPGGFSNRSLEAERAFDAVRNDLGQSGSVLVALFPSAEKRAGDPAFLEGVAAQADRLRGLPFVEQVVSPVASPRQVAPDGSLATVLIVLRVGGEDAPRLVPEVKRALGDQPFQPVVTGGPVAYADIVHVSEQDLRRAELVSIPLALIALVVVFGSLAAAGTPVVVGGLSVLVALALLALIARVTELSVFVLNLATMLGLGLGTDYSLFMTSRFREELAAGADVPTAVERTAERAGRAVFFSGITVFIGLLGLTSFEFMMLRSLGIGGAIVVGLAVAAALTLLPALLAIAGHRINALTVLSWDRVQASFWAELARAVMRRPWWVLVPVLLLLLLLGAPFLRARFSLPDVEVLPERVESRRGYELLIEAFGRGEVGPITLVLRAPDSILAPERIDALFDLSRHVAADPMVARVASIVDLDPRMTRDQYKLLYAARAPASDPYTRAALGVSTAGGTTTLTVVPRCGTTSPECVELVDRLRALRPGADLEMLVGGGPPAVIDIVRQLYATFPRAVVLVLATTYLALLVLFRSVVLPLKAIAMNALSLGASYGALVIVFQEGHGASLLGFEPLGYVEATLPIIMFCLLFGLSMDYEVFLLARVKEEWDRGASNAASVAAGLASSGRVITNAALIVVLVSLSFVTADVILVKAVGLGTALAVLLDATVVRALLVPATMRLLGDLNWWAPWPLRRALARIGGPA